MPIQTVTTPQESKPSTIKLQRDCGFLDGGVPGVIAGYHGEINTPNERIPFEIYVHPAFEVGPRHYSITVFAFDIDKEGAIIGPRVRRPWERTVFDITLKPGETVKDRLYSILNQNYNLSKPLEKIGSEPLFSRLMRHIDGM